MPWLSAVASHACLAYLPSMHCACVADASGCVALRMDDMLDAVVMHVHGNKHGNKQRVGEGATSNSRPGGGHD